MSIHKFKNINQEEFILKQIKVHFSKNFQNIISNHIKKI